MLLRQVLISLQMPAMELMAGTGIKNKFALGIGHQRTTWVGSGTSLLKLELVYCIFSSNRPNMV